MEVQELEVYSRDSNYAVIKPPGRNFPGCVIQGDSLSNLCRTAKDLAIAVKDKQTDSQEFIENVEELTNALVGRLLHYQEVLNAHGIPLPFSRPFSESDLVELVPNDESK